MPGLEGSDLVCCEGCGLVITSPRPTPDEIGSYYPAGYYAHVRHSARRRDRWIARLKAYRGRYPSADGLVARVAWGALARALGPLFLTQLPYAGKGRRLLDVGCGVGDALGWAADHGWEAHGVELDAEAVSIARARGLSNVRQGTLDEQAYPPEFFDTITLYQALEHVYSPRATLVECRRILRPGGRVFVSLPNFASIPRAAFGERWNGMQIPLHLYHFDARTLERLAGECGLQVEEVRYNAAPVALFTNLRHAVRTRMAAPPAPALSPTAFLPLLRLRPGRGLRLNDIMLLVLRRPPAPDTR